MRFSKPKKNCPIDVVKELSKDQKYMLEMCEATGSGRCSLELSMRDPGKMSYARWITTASRLLRLYIGIVQQSPNLRILVEYVMKVYAPIWFDIKCHSSVKDGAKHLFRLIHLSRYMTQEMKRIVDPVIERNGFFGHPENLLLAMISYSRSHVRELGLRRILQSRTKSQQRGIRVFKVPHLNFEAQDYIDLITWSDCVVTEPPLTMAITVDDLRKFINNDDVHTV